MRAWSLLRTGRTLSRGVILTRMPKRKSKTTESIPLPPVNAESFATLSTQKLETDRPQAAKHEENGQRPAKRRAKTRKLPSTNPDCNAAVLDGAQALRASPDADECDERMDVEAAGMDPKKQIKQEDDSVSSEKVARKAGRGAKKDPGDATTKDKVQNDQELAAAPKVKKEGKKESYLDPEAEDDEEADEEEVQAALSRPAPVHSDYLPLPWKGRLGYVCLDPRNLVSAVFIITCVTGIRVASVFTLSS